MDFLISGTLHFVDQGLEITLAVIMHMCHVTLMHWYGIEGKNKFTKLITDKQDKVIAISKLTFLYNYHPVLSEISHLVSL